jgi:methylmalonyl-CoA/ethylmalonyl-CoA epimerase
VLSRIHHVGIVVRSLGEAYRFWRDALGLQVHKEATVKDQGVKAALLPCGETEIELLEPIEPGGGVAKFLARRGEGLHHLCFQSDDVARELAGAKAMGLQLIDQTPRPGLAGMIGFLHPNAACGMLVEYATPPGGPDAHGTDLAFGHLAVVVDDVAGTTATFGRNFGLAPTPGGAAGSARLPIGASAIVLYTPAAAPLPLAGSRGLAGIDLRATALDALVTGLQARGIAVAGTGAGAAEIPAAAANGVPLSLSRSR